MSSERKLWDSHCAKESHDMIHDAPYCVHCGEHINLHMPSNPECEQFHEEYRQNPDFEYRYCPECGENINPDN